jgi:hypothetical protein
VLNMMHFSTHRLVLNGNWLFEVSFDHLYWLESSKPSFAESTILSHVLKVSVTRGMLPAEFLFVILRELRQALTVGLLANFSFWFTCIYVRRVPAVVSHGAFRVIKTSLVRRSQFNALWVERPLLVSETEFLGVTIGVRVALMAVLDALADFPWLFYNFTLFISLEVAVLRDALPTGVTGAAIVEIFIEWPNLYTSAFSSSSS